VACWEDIGDTIAEASYSHADLDELDAGDSEKEAEEAGAGGLGEEGDLWLFLIGEPSDTAGEGGGVGGGGGDGSGRALLNSVSSMEFNVKDEHGRSRVVLAVLSLLALLVQRYQY
jgi:hypothetical protein